MLSKSVKSVSKTFPRKNADALWKSAFRVSVARSSIQPRWLLLMGIGGLIEETVRRRGSSSSAAGGAVVPVPGIVVIVVTRPCAEASSSVVGGGGGGGSGGDGGGGGEDDGGGEEEGFVPTRFTACRLARTSAVERT